MQYVAAKSMPHLLTDNKEQKYPEVSQAMMKTFLKKSLQVTRSGFKAMSKQKPSPHNGSQKVTPPPKKKKNIKHDQM
jgi:hypothetical protein